MQTALVTGGTGGLGTAICKRLASDGFRVIANYLPELHDDAVRWQVQLREVNLQYHLLPGDVADPESCQSMAEVFLQQFGPPAVIVNNAGITRDATLRNLTLTDWQAVINTNLSSLYNVIKPLLDPMLETGYGRIVNISSVNGQRGQFGQTNYSAAKAGVHGFTKALAQEVARKGITVNTVSPGFIETEMVKTIPPAQRQAIVDAIPVGSIGQPADIANAVSFLVAEDAGYITGSEISVNGGIFMH
ncbi:MAG: acetoacetyl-CoA reductase [Granulosicoccus sp.]